MSEISNQTLKQNVNKLKLCNYFVNLHRGKKDKITKKNVCNYFINSYRGKKDEKDEITKKNVYNHFVEKKILNEQIKEMNYGLELKNENDFENLIKYILLIFKKCIN